MTLEDIARTGPMLVVAGLAAGWIAEAAARGGGYGLIRDMMLSVAGSVAAGLAVSSLIAGDIGMASTFLIGCVGAAVLIGAQRSFWSSGRPGPAG